MVLQMLTPNPFRQSNVGKLDRFPWNHNHGGRGWEFVYLFVFNHLQNFERFYLKSSKLNKIVGIDFTTSEVSPHERKVQSRYNRYRIIISVIYIWQGAKPA